MNLLFSLIFFNYRKFSYICQHNDKYMWKDSEEENKLLFMKILKNF